MKLAVAVACVAVTVPAHAGPRGLRQFGHHGAFHQHAGFHVHPRVFIGGSIFFPTYYPYGVPYSYPVYPPLPDWYPPPPGEPEDEGPDETERRVAARPEPAERASYGLVQLRGLPDGASVDLDGRFWLTANDLDDRWLALPEGDHSIAVRARGHAAVERRIRVKAGTTQTLRFGPFRSEAH